MPGMATVRDKSTGEPVLVEQITDDRQIGRWLAEHNLIAPPLPFEEPPHVGDPGEWVVARAVTGVWKYDVISAADYADGYEPFPE